jgi:hypothetical protein
MSRRSARQRGAFRVLDNRLGGGRIRPTVVEYLHTDIAPLLRQGRCIEMVRRHHFSAAADLTQLADGRPTT